MRKAVDLLYSVPCLKGLADDKNPHIRRFPQRFVYIGNHQVPVFHKSVHPLPNHTQAFLQGFFKRLPYGHHLSHRFHAAADGFIYTLELAQIPPRNFTNYII